MCEKLWVRSLYQKIFKGFFEEEVGSNAERLHPTTLQTTRLHQPQ